MTAREMPNPGEPSVCAVCDGTGTDPRRYPLAGCAQCESIQRRADRLAMGMRAAASNLDEKDRRISALEHELEAAQDTITTLRGHLESSRAVVAQLQEAALRANVSPKCDWCNKHVPVRAVPVPPWADPVICELCYAAANKMEGLTDAQPWAALPQAPTVPSE